MRFGIGDRRSCQVSKNNIMLRQKGLTAPARSSASRRWRQCRDVRKVRWLRKQLGLGIVDGDDGGALRAALIVGCLRYRLT
jgi:hypothetical protein